MPLVAAAAEITGPRRDGASVLVVVVVGVPNGPMASRRFFLNGGNPRPAGFVIQGWYGHIIGNMATMTIKSTYSLDVGTVRTLEELARRWNVSKSEALRRAIRGEAERQPSRVDARLQALRALQKSVAARGVDLDAWEREAAEIRSASFRRLSDEA